MAILTEDTCSHCGEKGMTQEGNELRCNSCGYRTAIFMNEDEQWLEDYNKTLVWDDTLFDDLPAVVGHEYFRLKWMFDHHKVYAAIVELKDVYECAMKFAVLCAAAEIRDPSLTAMLLPGNLSVGTWELILRKLCQVKNRVYVIKGVSEPLRAIIDDLDDLVNSGEIFGSGNRFSTWRNEFLGHGALGFSAGEKYKNSLKKMAQGLAKHFSGCREHYKKLTVLVDGKPMKYSDLIDFATLPDASKMSVSINGREVEIDPFMLLKEKGVYFFDDYKGQYDKAFALNYVIADKCRYYAPYFTTVYDSMKQQVEEYAERGRLDANYIEEKLAHDMNRLNEAYHFIEPKYITDWLTGSLYEKLDGKINDSFLDKGVLHLMMERGMGKTSFAYALDSQYDDSGHIKLRDTVVRVFYCSRVQLRSVQVFADGIHNELRRGIESLGDKSKHDKTKETEEDKKAFFPILDANASDKAANMVEFLRKFQEIHTGLNHGSRLLLVLDGLDEVPQECAEIFDFIPEGHMLADGCYILLTSRNPETEQFSPAIEGRILSLSADRTLSVQRGYEDNRTVMRQFIERMTKSMDEEHRIDITSPQADRLIDLADNTFLHLTMYLQLVRSGIKAETMESLPAERLLRFYLERLRCVYGDKTYADALKVLAVVLTAGEPLTLPEIAALSGRGKPDLMLLAYMKDFSPLFRCLHNSELRSGNTYTVSSESYATFVRDSLPDVYNEMVARYTDMLLEFDAKKHIDKNEDCLVPDELSHIAAHIGEYVNGPDFTLLKKIDDVDIALQRITDRYILERRIKMCRFIESRAAYLESIGQYTFRLRSLIGMGIFFSTMCLHEEALAVRTTLVETEKKYIEAGYTDDFNDLATAYMQRGATYYDKGQYQEALIDYNECISIMEKLHKEEELYDFNELATAYMNRGNTYCRKGEYTEALSDFDACIGIRKKLCKEGNLYDINDLATVCMNRGATYSMIGKYLEALSDFDVCISIRENLQYDGKLNDLKDLATAYINRGSTYCQIGEYSKSMSDYCECISIMRKLRDEGNLYDLNDLATAYMNRGITYNNIGKHTEALRDYAACICIREKLRDDGKL